MMYSEKYIKYQNPQKFFQTSFNLSIYRNIFKMLVSFNCSVLSDTFNPLDSFSVNLSKENNEDIIAKLGNNHYDFKEFKVDHLKDYICDRRKVAGSDRHAVKLWKVDVKDESDIKEKPKEDEMKPRLLFKDYFQDELNGVKFTVSNIHVIAIIPTTDYPNKRTRLDFNNIPLDLGRSPTPLLYTDGLYWDYQESPKLEEKLRNNVRELYDVFKENKREKTNTPIFFMVSGAGCGKSRNATELPNILCKIFDDDPELKSRLQEALIFNISLENSTKINMSKESNANVAIAKRMLYQLHSQGLHWTEIREYPDDVTILSILGRCAEQKEVKLKELTVILIVDGLQTALINQNDDMKKNSLFDSLMTEITILAINRDSPFVIACCTATLARPFHQVLAGSHQRRVFLPIRSLDPPKRGGSLIFKDTPLLNMLINDMGGNGRALEALATALKDVDIENDSFVSIAEKVYYQLKDHYNEWISHIHYLAPVLRVILTHTTLVESVPIPGTNILPEDLSRLGLIKFEKQDELCSEGTLTCPYIWLWLMANVSKSDSILRHWNFKYYNEIQANDGNPTIPPGCQFWQHFEHFIASFRVLKSKVFETDKEIKLQDIHAGAKHNFGTATIRNIPLSLAKATRQQSTKSSAYSANKMVTCKKGDAQINLDLEGASACIINGSSAPAGDSFCPIYFGNSPQFHIESHQCKCLKSTTVNQKTFDEEREKACDKDDVFILYTCECSNVTSLPSLSAIVDRDCWKSYFGPFAGRAFLLVQNKPFNVNNAKPSELTSVTGIGPICAKLLIQERQKSPFDNLEDCFNRTRISRSYLINFQFN
ncbi:hypothetical protein C1646_276735 [Rhizophagus diaphanus]|nr:hypothetical protein C1646_276735 [Rhizophagus diaphanus] [Rhizophagus sp. MUCL 43196]